MWISKRQRQSEELSGELSERNSNSFRLPRLRSVATNTALLCILNVLCLPVQAEDEADEPDWKHVVHLKSGEMIFGELKRLHAFAVVETQTEDKPKELYFGRSDIESVVVRQEDVSLDIPPAPPHEDLVLTVKGDVFSGIVMVQNDAAHIAAQTIPMNKVVYIRLARDEEEQPPVVAQDPDKADEEESDGGDGKSDPPSKDDKDADDDQRVDDPQNDKAFDEEVVRRWWERPPGCWRGEVQFSVDHQWGVGKTAINHTLDALITNIVLTERDSMWEISPQYAKRVDDREVDLRLYDADFRFVTHHPNQYTNNGRLHHSNSPNTLTKSGNIWERDPYRYQRKNLLTALDASYLKEAPHIFSRHPDRSGQYEFYGRNGFDIHEGEIKHTIWSNDGTVAFVSNRARDREFFIPPLTSDSEYDGLKVRKKWKFEGEAFDVMRGENRAKRSGHSYSWSWYFRWTPDCPKEKKENEPDETSEEPEDENCDDLRETLKDEYEYLKREQEALDKRLAALERLENDAEQLQKTIEATADEFEQAVQLAGASQLFKFLLTLGISKQAAALVRSGQLSQRFATATKTTLDVLKTIRDPKRLPKYFSEDLYRGYLVGANLRKIDDILSNDYDRLLKYVADEFNSLPGVDRDNPISLGARQHVKAMQDLRDVYSAAQTLVPEVMNARDDVEQRKADIEYWKERLAECEKKHAQGAK